MALAALRHSWLLALADPAGPVEPLPEKRLRPWDLAAVCELADRHGVLPTVLANLRQVAAREGPGRAVRISSNVDDKAILADAEKSVLRQTGMAMLLRRQAAEATAALARASVPVLVLKGPEFADRLYPQPAARLFTDVDLFIPQTAADAAEGVMRDLGYEPTATSMKYEEGYGERGWRRPKSPSGLVEVHWNLVNSPTLRRVVSVEFADLQLETAPGKSGGPRMSPASILLVAAVHGATSHGFDKLRMLYDVAQAVRGAAGPMDEAWLSRTAAATGATLALETALRLTEEVLPEPRCGQLLARLNLPPATWLSKAALSRGAVLRGHAAIDGLRRQAFRELLKRP